MKKLSIYIRVDGNQEMGLGHLVRCIALAQMLKKSFEIIFVCLEVPDKIAEEINENCFRLVKISTEEEFIKLLGQKDIVVLDGYHFCSDLQKRIKALKTKLVCIDDLHKDIFYADLIINHAPGVKPEDYKRQNYTQLALGLDYALLRPVFLSQAQCKKERTKVETVLICFGGSDYKNLTESTLKVVSEFSEFKKIIVVTGSAYNHANIHDLIKKEQRGIHYHAINQTEMLECMREADLAIVPSSGILLEALSVGGKVISGMYAENQKILFERFKRIRAFISAERFKPEDLKLALKKVITTNWKVQKVLDGKSGHRVRILFYELASSVRRVSEKDSKLLFDWANDYEVRKNAISQEPIVWESHEKWYKSKIMSNNSVMYILDFNGVPIGQVRFDKKRNYWIIDYSIDTKFRGMGFGKIILNKTLKYFSKERIRASVKLPNVSSAKVFQSLNFKEGGTEEINGELYKTYEL